MSTHKRAYTFRFYPNNEQKHILARTFGCVRVVYNWALRHKTDVLYHEQRCVYYKDLSSMLTDLKKQESYIWLNEASSVPTQQALHHLDKAIINFFEGRGSYPTFKKKSHQQSAEYTRSAFSYRDGTVTLAKMDAPPNIRWSLPLSEGACPSSVTISKESAERYFISMLVEEDMAHLPFTKQTVGADLGLKSFVILSTGETIGNPKFFAKDEKKLAKAHHRHFQRWNGWGQKS